jgi:hypothetical protein
MSDPTHPLYWAELKLRRASDQFGALKEAIKTFFDSKPYSFRNQVDPETEIAWRLVCANGVLDPMWNVVIGEIVHDYRCVLDYLVYQLVVRDAGAPPTDNKSQFPIFKTRAGFDSRGVPLMLRGVGREGIAFIEAAQPFATGEGEKSHLWQLQELSNRDKHRSIVIASAAVIKSHASTKVINLKEDFGMFVKPGFLEEEPGFGRTVPKGSEPLLDRVRKITLDGEVTCHMAFKNPLFPIDLSAESILSGIGERVRQIGEGVHNRFFQPED